ncbi:hypothetical protein GCM10009716_23370 [Streptomyces sodiiphilus]|uniref:Right-handed parallel beta-helix repeat-containing protein n=1 Tax=Streptomyces sodiiphilus TaxID=226217 RepID=A0ABN2P5M8_9ACTN
MNITLRRGTLSAALALGMCLAALPPWQAQAATFVPCNDIAGLKAAINDANVTGTSIALASGCTYNLTTAETGDDGLPEITGNVRISATFGATIRRAPTATEEFRIFHVVSGGSLTLNRITVSGGRAGITPDGFYGGGIYNEGGSVTLNNATVRNNWAYSGGGGIYSEAGTLILNQTTVRNNSTEVFGGGIQNAGGTLRMREGALRDNTAGFDGGGLENFPDGTATLDAVLVTGNTADRWGGGIDNFDDSRLRLNSTVVRGNQAELGGGIYNDESLATLASSRVTGNTATGGPQSGGGIYNSDGDVVLLGSAVTANTPDNCAPPGGVPGCVNPLGALDARLDAAGGLDVRLGGLNVRLHAVKTAALEHRQR